MQHIAGVPRGQTSLFPPTVEEYVSAEHPVRVIDAFVEGLDVVELGFEKAETEATGRPPFHPGDLLKLYLYGYLNQIRSSRKLERECQRNVEVMWLMGRLCPDFKTIANFRKENSEAIRGVCRAFVRFCREQDLFGGELVAIDGSKVPAVASRRQAVTAGQLEQRLERVDEQIEQFLKQLDEGDAQEAGDEQRRGNTAAILERLQQKKQELQWLAMAMRAEGNRQYVVGEPEARIMGTGHGPMVIGYNAQTAVDEKNKLIVHHEVVDQANDNRQLYPMARAAKAALGCETLSVVADSGYCSGEQAERCEAEGIVPAVPSQKRPATQYFDRDAFVYDVKTDTYRCPAGEELTFEKVNKQRKARLYTTAACESCSLRTLCTKGKRRAIWRSDHGEALQRADQRSRSNPALIQRRRNLVEHPFAWLKRTLAGRFLSRGLRNVRAEMALAVTSYNLLRAINIVGVPKLLEALAV